MTSSERDPLLSDPYTVNVNQISKAKLYWTLAGLWTAVYLGALDGTIVATLQQPIAAHFDQSQGASYIGASYLLSICCFTPLYGRLSDIIGRKWAMLSALTLFTFGTFLCGEAPSMNTLIAARVIAGMGSGGIMTVSSVVMTDLVPLRDRGMMQAASNILFGAGAALGGPFGGYISDTFGWRKAFLVQIPLLVTSSIIVFINVEIVLPQTRLTLKQKLKQIDWLGSLALITFVTSVMAGLSFKATEDLMWKDARVWCLLTGGGLAAVAFVFVEAHVSPEPIMPMRIVLRRTPLSLCLTNFFGSIASYSLIYNVPLYCIAVRLQTTAEAGISLLPFSVALGIGSVGSGWIMRRTGSYRALTIASTGISLLGTGLMSLWNRKNTSDPTVWLDVSFNGFGFASASVSTLIAMLAYVSRDDAAVATGVVYLFRTTGRVLGVGLSGALFQAVLRARLRETMPGPGAAKKIDEICRNATLVRELEGAQREAAISSFERALKVVFICQVALSVLAVLCALPMEEKSLLYHEEARRMSHNDDEET